MRPEQRVCHDVCAVSSQLLPCNFSKSERSPCPESPRTRGRIDATLPSRSTCGWTGSGPRARSSLRRLQRFAGQYGGHVRGRRARSAGPGRQPPAPGRGSASGRRPADCPRPHDRGSAEIRGFTAARIDHGGSGESRPNRDVVLLHARLRRCRHGRPRNSFLHAGRPRHGAAARSAAEAAAADLRASPKPRLAVSSRSPAAPELRAFSARAVTFRRGRCGRCRARRRHRIRTPTNAPGASGPSGTDPGRPSHATRRQLAGLILEPSRQPNQAESGEPAGRAEYRSPELTEGPQRHQRPGGTCRGHLQHDIVQERAGRQFLGHLWSVRAGHIVTGTSLLVIDECSSSPSAGTSSITHLASSHRARARRRAADRARRRRADWATRRP